jgi:hypothetical protein
LAVLLTALGAAASAAPPPPAAEEISRPDAPPAADQALTEKVVALASEAIDSKRVPKWARKILTELSLPALRGGCVGVIKVRKEDIPGAAAIYDNTADVIKTPDFDPGDVKAVATILHELTHVGQDAAKLTQERKDSEFQASIVEAEYEMRSKNILRESDDGAVAIEAENITKMDPIWKDLIYGYAIQNVRDGKSELNGFADDSKVAFKGEVSSDVMEYYRQNQQTAHSDAVERWGTNTRWGAMMGGSVKDPNERLVRDGLTRCKGR